MSNLETAKHNMVEQQIRPWNIDNEDVLTTFETLNRHDFVPQQYKNLAYADCQIPLTATNTMMKPVIEARLLQALNVTKEDKCLEIGTGSGYLTACLASLGESVHTIEINTDTINQAKQKLSAFRNITFQNASLDNVSLGENTYNAIAVTGSTDSVTQVLKSALKVNGRLFVIVGEAPSMQALLVTRTDANSWSTVSLFETEIDALN
ncbi:MAG: protein-L-isoaspartate O-methyltransferase [Gammaproteobacteria bacterium]|nr:protein-L-isoaspartate O-methyltransferase [Gammaproteobacteria bacterium]